ncbi:MAG: hypothetical protein FWH40_09985 [Coriobacteriia bacterium]|nr:hypothetical protein [Coriobacteriia bacterium]
MLGVIISSISHALSLVEYPDMAYEQSWDEYNYNVIYGHTRGTISFTREAIVGAFRNERSDRIDNYPQTRAVDYFHDAPQLVQDIAITDTLEYLYDRIGDTEIPVATTAIWSEGESLYSSDEEDVFYLQGGEFLQKFFQPEEQLYELVADGYEFEESVIEGIRSLVALKAGSIFTPVSINMEHLVEIIGSSNEDLDACINALSKININVAIA